MKLLSEIFEEYYQAKIIEVILENYNEEFTTKDIMKMAETAQGSTYKYIQLLVSKGILIETRKIGKIQLYRLNLENNFTQAFLLFENSLVISELDKKIKEKEEKKILIKESRYEKDIYYSALNKYHILESLNVNMEKPQIVISGFKEGDVNKWKKLIKV
jgi:hypothetical protein